MRTSLFPATAVALAIPVLLAGCVTVTPIRVASEPTPATTTGSPTALPLPSPTTTPPSAATPAPSDASPTGKPGKPGKPGKTPKPQRTPGATPTPTTGPIGNTNDPACFDDAYTLEGFSWDDPFEWRYNSPSTPAGYDADDVVAVLQRGFANVTTENNDCGRPDLIAEDATYMGNTPAVPCTPRGDGLNVVGWGHMPDDLSEDTIAYTCPYHYSLSGEIAEADIVISLDVDWALSADACVFQELLEPTITHEVGHALGLGHVSERVHPDMTMSTRSNGPCSDEESTLGLGDMLGLESLYPPD
jgi:hypothetical protein